MAHIKLIISYQPFHYMQFLTKHLPRIIIPFILLFTSLTGYCGTYNWIGTGANSNWNTGANWQNAVTLTTGNVPGNADIAQIGVVAFSGSQPVVTASATCSGLIFGNATATTLTVNTGATLTVSSTFTNSATVNAVVNGTLLFSGNFTNSGTVTQTGSGNLSIAGVLTNSGTYNQSGTGILTLTTSNISNSGIINQTSSGSISVFGSLVNSTTTSSFTQTGSGSITIGGYVSNSGTITQNNGPITVAGTFTNSGTTSAFIQNGNGTVSIVGKTTNGGTFTQKSGAITLGFDMVNTGTLNLGSANFSISGDYTNSGTFTGGTGTCIFNDPGSIAIKDNGNGTIFNNVQFINGNNNVIQSGNFGVKSTGVLTLLNNGTKLTINAAVNFTLYSDVNGSATVAPIPTGGNSSIQGNVTVQRYVQGYRAYRLMSSAVNTNSETIGTKTNVPVYNINYLQNESYISVTDGVAGGSTTGATSTNPSLYLYRENLSPLYTTFLNSNFIGFKNTTSAPLYSMDDSTYPTAYIPVGNGFLMFFRGVTGTPHPFVAGSPANAGSLSSTGTLNQGNITVYDWYAPAEGNLGYTAASGNPTIEGTNLVGNPYPSSIDWDKYGTGIQETNVSSFVYQLIPSGLQGSGNYNVYQANTNVGGNKQGTQGTANSNIIVSGEGFFVQATNTGASLTFTESAKTNTEVTGANLYMSKGPIASTITQSLRLQMAKDSINTDGIIINFNPNTKATFNAMEDAHYRQGTGPVSLASLSSDNIPLAINQLPLSPKGDTIKLKIAASAYGNYSLNMKTIQGIPQYYNIWLKDAFTKDSVNMRTTSTYSFAITTDTSSYGSRRFSLVLGIDPSYTYKLISFDGSKIDHKSEVQLVWKTQNEQNFIHFTVERSTDDGKTFNVVGGFLSTGAGQYGLTDKNPVTGTNIYRLKQEDYNNNITYSQNVQEQITDKDQLNVSCFPNPAASDINLTIVPKKPGETSYTIRVTNSCGTVVRYAVVKSTSWQDNISNLLNGTYLIQVVETKNNNIIGQTKFVKL